MARSGADKELLELFQKAQRAADKVAKDDESPSEAEESRCLDALMALQAFPVTVGILVSTQVGKKLRNLTKHPRETIRTVALDLLDDWKKKISSTTTVSNNGNNSSKAEDKQSKSVKVETSYDKAEAMKVNKSLKMEDTQSRSIKVEANPIKIESVKVEKKVNVGADSHAGKQPSSSLNAPPKLTAMLKSNDSMRDKFRELLAEAFTKVPSEAEAEDLIRVRERDPIRAAVSVETVMFEKLGRSNGPHKLKYRSIMFNLKDSKNPDLRRRVLLGDIKPERLIVMTPDEMASDERKLQNKQIKDKALFECERGINPSATTDQFKCGKCGQRKCTYYQMQTRSADEPMTTFVTCVNCNNHWKFC